MTDGCNSGRVCITYKLVQFRFILYTDAVQFKTSYQFRAAAIILHVCLVLTSDMEETDSDQSRPLASGLHPGQFTDVILLLSPVHHVH